MSSFSNKKQLEYQIKLGKGAKFASTGADTIVLTGFRSSIDVVNAGAFMIGQCKVRIFGVSQSIMNDVTTMQWQQNTLRNASIECYAIDGDMRSFVFRGDIRNAWGDYSSPPDVFLTIEASSNYFFQIEPVEPSSFKGVWKIKDVFNWYAQKMGLTLEYEADDRSIENAYYDNTLMNQLKLFAKDVRVDMSLTGSTIIVTEQGKPYQPKVKCLVSKETGLVGYPLFDAISITCKTLYNPTLMHKGLVEIKTELNNPLIRTSGEWVVASVSHTLESEKPNGQWFTTFRANYNGNAYK